MKHPAVLIVSDDAEFPRLLTARWQSERTLPTFTMINAESYKKMGGNGTQSSDPAAFDAAIVGRVDPDRIDEVLRALSASGKPAIVISKHGAGQASSRILTLPEHDSWLDTTVLLMTEMLRRLESDDRSAQLAIENALLQRDATLGRFIVEMRHTVNNALTSVLGNSELLLIEPGVFSAETRSQVETIHNMSLRIHEILQRFSSLEKELNVLELQSEKQNKSKAQAAK